jgi:hypothetical protein
MPLKIDHLLEHMVRRMEIAVNEWPNCQYKQRQLNMEEFPKGKWFHYIVDEIKSELENSIIKGKQYSFVVGTRTFTVYAMYPETSRMNMGDYLDACIKKMYVWFFVANDFCQSTCSPNVSVYWYLSKHKKTFPTNDGLIDRSHVNTGFTQPCTRGDNYIYLFREEEWFKVLIHESMHSFGMDFANVFEDEINTRLHHTFKISAFILFTESYAEIWAEIIQIIFISVNEYNCREPFIRISKLKNTIEKRLKHEVDFSMVQMCKILHHNKIEYDDLFGSNIYREGSQVFSYYVLKTILIFFYDDFLDWCTTHNENTICFKKTHENIISLLQFIELKCRNPWFLKSIQFVSRKIREMSADHVRTLRMSINEFTK